MSIDIVEILNEPKMTKVCAPMVRYSKLAFRELVRQYNCDICFTPMILADSFVQSEKARNNEFTTNSYDKPLVVQFAAKNTTDFLKAAELIYPYSNGVDLNCGCPQRWAIKDGYGVDLLSKPELIRDLVLQVRNKIKSPFTVSVKIRILKDINKTIELCRILEKTGVSFLTVHARTPQMRKEPIDIDALKLINESVDIPVIANGDVKTLDEANKLWNITKSQGVMVANGLLTNPALFSGVDTTPISCVQNWIDITEIIPTNFMTMHHHLVFMLEKIIPKNQRVIFNSLQNKNDVYHYLNEHLDINYTDDSSFELLTNFFDDNLNFSG
ncbi:tRNA-dihydrouridine(20a/20b) synthase [NAD(P)+]-like [Aphidius gifuensis]|uniref:tRNA-dihydrouridine(20a/20b) synthase [NAD(P)+]-like n=1 Tax=Aphidius gifuensis TaxID=684658 RepID=UPI001CDCDCE5|nr:tRNA-dihydrouridine(20a/20b) synthase [NAD(P)+]-like [Aphidius gifuensis]